MAGKKTTYPNSLGFRCDEGFILSGSWLRKCQTDGKWSGNETKCQGLIILASFTLFIETLILFWKSKKNTNRKLENMEWKSDNLRRLVFKFSFHSNDHLEVCFVLFCFLVKSFVVVICHLELLRSVYFCFARNILLALTLNSVMPTPSALNHSYQQSII